MNCNIGKQIFNLRKAKGISQAELADFLGIQSQTVSKWEREICAPDLAKLPQIAAFFAVTLDELFGISKKSAQESAHSELDALISQKKWSAAAKKAAAFAIEFPVQKIFVQKMLASLSQALLCGEHFSKKFTEEAIALAKRAVPEINEPNIKNDIIYSLGAVLYMVGRTEEADFYREMLPTAAICREALDIFKYRSGGMRAVMEQNISVYHALLANSLWEIAVAAQEGNASIEYMEKALYHYGEACKYGKNTRCSQNALLANIAVAKTYLGTGNKAKAEEFFEKAENFAREHGLLEICKKYF